MSKAIVKHRIKINPYDKESIENAVAQMRVLSIAFSHSCYLIRRKVAERVMQHATDLYKSSWYNDWVHQNKHELGYNQVPLSIEETDEVTTVVAGGVAVFIEFGTGVTHNGGTIYSSYHPLGKELGFTIGSYPGVQGVPSKGQQPLWWVKSEQDFTRGTDAQMVLYRAVRYTLPDIEEIVKEVVKR